MQDYQTPSRPPRRLRRALKTVSKCGLAVVLESSLLKRSEARGVSCVMVSVLLELMKTRQAWRVTVTSL